MVWRRADTAGTGAFTSGDVSQLDGVKNRCFFLWFFGCLAVPLSFSQRIKKMSQNTEQKTLWIFLIFYIIIIFGSQKCNISFDDLTLTDRDFGCVSHARPRSVRQMKSKLDY